MKIRIVEIQKTGIIYDDSQKGSLTTRSFVEIMPQEQNFL